MAPPRARGARGPQERREAGTRYPRGGIGTGIGTGLPPPRLLGGLGCSRLPPFGCLPLDEPALAGVGGCGPQHQKVAGEICFLVGGRPGWAWLFRGVLLLLQRRAGKEGNWGWDLGLGDSQEGQWDPGSLLVPGDTARGKGTKLCRRKFRLDRRQRFCTHRMVGHWSRLPGEVLTAPAWLSSGSVWQ